MRISRVSIERWRETISAAVLLTMAACLPRVAAQEIDAQEVDAQPIARSRSEATPSTARPADPEELARLRYAGKSFRDWQELYLTDLEPATRLKALPALKKFGRYGYAREAAETIAAAFADDDSELVQAAVTAAASIGPDAVPMLVELCKVRRGAVRCKSAESLKEMGEDAAAAAPALFELLAAVDGADADKFDELEYRYVWEALEQMASASLPLLLERLDSPRPKDRALAAELLGQAGPQATIATPSLLDAFDDVDSQVRAQVGAALWKVASEDEQVFAALHKAIRSDDAEAREGIVRAIREWLTDPYVNSLSESPKLSKGISLLGDALRLPSFAEGIAAYKEARVEGRVYYAAEGGPNAKATNEVVWALVQAGGRAKSLVPDLVKLLESDNEKAVAAVASVLGSIGPEAASTLPKLRSIVERREKQGVAADDEFLQAARAAIERIENPPDPAHSSPYGSNAYSQPR